MVTAGGRTQTLYLDAGCHYMGTSALTAHAGLGAATVIDRLDLIWADGVVDTFTGLPANRFLRFAASPSQR